MIFLVLILVLVLLLIAILTINTIKASKNARKLSEFKPFYNEKEIEYYVNRLGKMIQCKTVSVKDSFDDTEFAKLRDVMVELFPTVHKVAEKMTFSDDCWIYKIKGKDESRNIMLMSHHDVVDATGEWEHEGFGGEVADGKIWGRGTVDTKTPLFAEFSALEELLNEGFVPPCNVWIGSSHNEEIGGDGIPTALKYFQKNNITFEVILDEGGALIEPPLGGMKADKCGMVAVHEKGRISLICTANANSNPASLTSADKLTPVERMSAFVNEITTNDVFIRRINPQVEAMFKHLGPYCGFPMNMLFANLWLFGGIIKKVMPKINAQAGGLIGTTCTFNNIEGSSAMKKCTAKAFVRPVDEKDFQEDLKKFKQIAEKYDIMVEMTEDSEYHGPADMTKPQFEYTMDCIGEIFPQYPASPFILPAGTDARTLTDVCPCVLRFAPIKLSAQQLGSVHSENENIDVDSVANCVAFYKHYIKNYK